MGINRGSLDFFRVIRTKGFFILRCIERVSIRRIQVILSRAREFSKCKSKSVKVE